MSSDNKFYGMYRAIIADANDPKNLGRAMLIVPQVLGQAVTDWAWPVGGQLTQSKFPYITLTSTSVQPVTAANTATLIQFTNVEFSNYMRLENGTKIVATEEGEYFLQFSVVFAKSTSTSANVDIWYLLNGTPIPRSNTRAVTTGNPNEVTLTVAGITPLKPGDYIQLAFSSPDPNVRMQSFTGLTNPVRPDMPGIVFSANLVGKWKPKPNTAVWAMFEGGDPNFPLWIGGS